MKNTFFLAVATLLISAAVQAQSTVDSIAAKYKLLPMPGALTIEKTFPVLGAYELSNAAEGQSAVTIKLDESNKGIVWIEGLPQGTFKAYMKKAPATYRIIAQKSSTGKQIPEGTLFFDEAANTLHIALGAFIEADPIAVFPAIANADAAVEEAKVKVKTPTSKQKAKITFYTASKKVADVEATTETSMNN